MEHSREVAADHVDVLRGGEDDKVALVEERQRVVRLHGVAVEHRIAVLALDDEMRARERLVDVAPFDARDRAHIADKAFLAFVHTFVPDALAAALVKDRCVRLERLLRVDHDRKVFVGDVDELRRLGSLALGLRDHDRDRLALEADPLDREDRVIEDYMAVVRSQARGQEVISDQNADHSRTRGGRGAVDARDGRVRPRRADDERVRHPRHRQIDRIARPAGHLRDGVRAPGGRPDDAVRLLHRALRIWSAASSTASTIVW